METARDAMATTSFVSLLEREKGLLGRGYRVRRVRRVGRKVDV